MLNQTGDWVGIKMLRRSMSVMNFFWSRWLAANVFSPVPGWGSTWRRTRRTTPWSTRRTRRTTPGRRRGSASSCREENNPLLYAGLGVFCTYAVLSVVSRMSLPRARTRNSALFAPQGHGVKVVASVTTTEFVSFRFERCVRRPAEICPVIIKNTF